MKSQARAADPQQATIKLCEALLTLQTTEECRCFLEDLCTPSELEALTDRWAVVGHLENGRPYREIHELTGVSVTTIGRVARFLERGNGGYPIALERLSSRPSRKTK